MAENINEVHTVTNTVTETENKEQTTVFITSKYNISAPLFLMFAEYLGYVSKALTWVDNWCVAKKRPQPWQIKFIETEAYIVLEEAKKKIGPGYGINRYKGLGEMNADQLYNTTMNKATRKLYKVTIEDPLVVEKRISILMGNDHSQRRAWIEENVSFNEEDTFIKEVKK